MVILFKLDARVDVLGRYIHFNGLVAEVIRPKPKRLVINFGETWFGSRPAGIGLIDGSVHAYRSSSVDVASSQELRHFDFWEMVRTSNSAREQLTNCTDALPATNEWNPVRLFKEFFVQGNTQSAKKIILGIGMILH